MGAVFAKYEVFRLIPTIEGCIGAEVRETGGNFRENFGKGTRISVGQFFLPLMMVERILRHSFD